MEAPVRPLRRPFAGELALGILFGPLEGEHPGGEGETARARSPSMLQRTISPQSAKSGRQTLGMRVPERLVVNRSLLISLSRTLVTSWSRR